jgi:putative ABC transport system permease protein
MIWENIQLAFSTLVSNKMRSLLTMLGIIIGIMSIITIVIIGDAMTSSVSDNLSSLGASNINISIQEKSSLETESLRPGGVPGAIPGQAAKTSISGKTPSSDDLISDQMIEDMRANFVYDIQGVSLSHSGGSATVQDGDLKANVSINGTNVDYLLANSVTLLSGRYISDADLAEKSMTAVVSEKLILQMFPGGSDPLGEQIKLYKTNSIEIFTIVGVYQHEQNAFMGSTVSDEHAPTNIYIPVTTAKQDVLEKNFTSVTVIGAPGSDVHELTSSLQSYFDGIYSNNNAWRVNVSNMASMLDAVTGTLSTISLAIAFIAGISLLVGGIGVMNIMLVSVTERTREIGTRKALGAKNFHIQFQFVMEAMIIALFGGIIGMILGIGLGAAVAAIFAVPLVVSPVTVIGSVLFAMVIGVFFGFFPANKAAKLDPIDALRYE